MDLNNFDEFTDDWTQEEIDEYEAEMEFEQELQMDIHRERGAEAHDQMSRAGIDPMTATDTFIKMNGDTRYVTEV